MNLSSSFLFVLALLALAAGWWAVVLLKKKRTAAMEMARLKRAYDEGRASGEGREVEEASLLAKLKAEAHTR